MSKKSYLRGHEIELQGANFIYSDTKELTSETWHKRPCGVCNKLFTKEGHDPCLGTIYGAMNACCGHGENETAYIQYNDGSHFSGSDAIDEFKLLGIAKAIINKTDSRYKKL